MATFSLITVHTQTDSTVSGMWLQDCCRGLDVAIQLCKDTSAINSNQKMAIVPGMPHGAWDCFEARPLFVTP